MSEWQAPGWKAKELNKETAEEVAAWTEGVLVEEINPETGARTVGLNFPGQEGVMRASEGDFVVRMDDGSFQRWSAKFLEQSVGDWL